MTRPRGDGGLSWSESRQRWIAAVTVGYDGRGKRVVRRASGRTKTEALRRLREMTRAREDGLAVGDGGYTVRQAVQAWLEHGQPKAAASTRTKSRILCETHVVPLLGARKLRDLRAAEVDRWLKGLSASLSSRTLYEVRSCLNRAVRFAMARELVHRNVVELCQVPRGREGRPSKSLTVHQARDVLGMTVDDPLHCYIVVSLLTGARTEELRALRWEHVHLEDDLTSVGPRVPPHLEVWRSVREGADTKTRKSRRTLALPAYAVEVLRSHRKAQVARQLKAGDGWADPGLVFTTSAGTALDAANVRRDFRRALGLVPGIRPEEWTPREMRHSFVSLLSEAGLAIEDISRLVGHSGTHVTELVYRKQLRPVIQSGATVMDALFGTPAASESGDQ